MRNFSDGISISFSGSDKIKIKLKWEASHKIILLSQQTEKSQQKNYTEYYLCQVEMNPFILSNDKFSTSPYYFITNSSRYGEYRKFIGQKRWGESKSTRDKKGGREETFGNLGAK